MVGKKERSKEKAEDEQLEALFLEAWQACSSLQFSAGAREKDYQQQVLHELAGAVAHELFQPLTAMAINAELLLRQMGPDDPGRPYAEMILKDIERLAELVCNIDKISTYKTKPYLGETKILDLDKSAPSKAKPKTP